jgi:hypothetical protein
LRHENSHGAPAASSHRREFRHQRPSDCDDPLLPRSDASRLASVSRPQPRPELIKGCGMDRSRGHVLTYAICVHTLIAYNP